MLDKRLSPLAQATLTAMVSSPDSHGPYNAVGSGPYPSVASSRSQASPYAPLLSPRKTTLAEAWGKAEPEPFEEFSAGAGTIGRSPANSIDGGYEGYYRNQLPKSSSRQKDISRQLVDQGKLHLTANSLTITHAFPNRNPTSTQTPPSPAHCASRNRRWLSSQLTYRLSSG